MIPDAPTHLSFLQDKEPLQKSVQIEHHSPKKEQIRKGSKTEI